MKKRHGKFRKSVIKIMVLLSAVLLLPPVQTYAAPGYDQIAGGSVKSKPVGTYGMTPIFGERIKDGTYTVDTRCSSSFFKILDATLTVSGGEMTAVLSMSSNSYSYVYPGTAEEAAAAPVEEYIPLEKWDTGSSFTIPVEALNMELNCAAFSKKKEKWYDRKILFDAGSLPEEALEFSVPDYEVIEEALKLYDETNGTDVLGEASDAAADTEEDLEKKVQAAAIERKDGSYSIDVSLSGGSGRASVSAPTWLYVQDGKAYAKLLWSSAYYDYMIVDGQTYYNETTDGSNSTFTIPITVLDEPMNVIADTTALGDPLEIEYVLTFYLDTVGGTGQIPQEAAKRVLILALGIIVFGGIMNYFVKKKNYR